jgi:hypothetical protein
LRFGKLLPEKKHCFRAKDNQHPSAWSEQLPAHQLAVLSTGWGQFFQSWTYPPANYPWLAVCWVSLFKAPT